jgi:hypothetical protein
MSLQTFSSGCPAVESDQLLDSPLERDRFPCLDLDVARRALEAAPELVDEHLGDSGAPSASPAGRRPAGAPRSTLAIPTAIVVIAGLTSCIAS